MASHSSPKRHQLAVTGRPEGGLGETGPVVVSPSGPLPIKRDIAATVHELVDTLLALASVDRAPAPELTGDLPLLLNAVEAGKLLSISRSKVLDLAARGHLPSLRVGGSVRIPRDQLVEWISRNSTFAAQRWSAERLHRRDARSIEP